MSSRSEIYGIQYLRAVAAISVVMAHSAEMAASNKYFGREVLGGLLHKGQVGVDLFFLISGFVITLVAVKGPTLHPRLTLSQFAWRRFARIVPLMWVAILAYVGLRLLGRGSTDVSPYIRAFFLLPGDLAPSVIWTLRHEFVFYIVFALSFLTIPRRPWIMALWSLSPLIYLFLALPALTNGSPAGWLGIATNPVNFEFAAGMLIGILWHKRTSGLVLRIPVAHPSIVLTAAFCLIVLFAHAIRDISPLAYRFWIALACAPIVLVAAHAACSRGVVHRLALFLGHSSYAIYLFHLHIVSAELGVLAHFTPGMPVGLVIVTCTLLATAGGVAIHLLVEKPLVEMVKRLGRRSQLLSGAT